MTSQVCIEAVYHSWQKVYSALLAVGQFLVPVVLLVYTYTCIVLEVMEKIEDSEFFFLNNFLSTFFFEKFSDIFSKNIFPQLIFFVLKSFETYAKKSYHQLFLREGGLQIVN